MTKDPTTEVIRNIQRLYKENTSASRLFEALAGRRKALKAMSIDRLAQTLGLSRGEAVAFARILEQNGCGEFRMGRRGLKSRFIWAFSPVSLGKAAVGEDDELEEIDELEDTDTDLEDDEPIVLSAESARPSIAQGGTLTISEARERLAQSLGVPLSSVEITIKLS